MKRLSAARILLAATTVLAPLCAGPLASPVHGQDAEALGSHHTTWGLPPSPTGRRLGHVLEALARQDVEFTRSLVTSAFAPAFRDQFPIETHVGVINQTGAGLGSFELADVRREPGGRVVALAEGDAGAVRIVMLVEEQEPFQIVQIGFQPPEDSSGGAADSAGCEGRPEYRLLDFWVGDWRVTSRGIEQGSNRIEKVSKGCAVLEHWTDVLGGQGTSLFYYDPTGSTWKQVWVTDHGFEADGGVLHKELIAAGPDSLVFQGTVGGNDRALSRTTLTRRADGTVRQFIERSNDGGATWQTTFDAVYERASGPEVVGAVARRWSEGGFTGQVLVVRDGRIVHESGHGSVGPETEAAIGHETVFAIGSVTKQFTKVAVLALEQDGRLHRSDRLGDLLPNVPADKAAITVEQLLNMTAGLQEYHDDEGDHQPMTRGEALARILSQELRFSPGAERAYSNSGYVLLAAIVEDAAGVPYHEYVRTRLLEPVGLTQTGFHGDRRWNREHVARGRGGLRFGENAPDTWPAPTWALQGAGGMVSSPRELSRWITALRGGAVIEPALVSHAYAGPTALYAGGDDFGFTTGIIEIDDGRTHVVVSSASGADVIEMANDLIEALTGRPSPYRQRLAS